MLEFVYLNKRSPLILNTNKHKKGHLSFDPRITNPAKCQSLKKRALCSVSYSTISSVGEQFINAWTLFLKIARYKAHISIRAFRGWSWMSIRGTALSNLRSADLRYGDKPVWLASSDCGVILGRPKEATQAFLSRCLSNLARASLSPPIHTGGLRFSVSNPEI